MTSEILLSVPGMNCGHCEAAVAKEVGALAEVSEVTVDLEAKTVRVVGEQLDRVAIVEAVDEAGFDVA